MALNSIALKDANGVLFTQLAADNGSSRTPAVVLSLWNSATPVPVDDANPVPVRTVAVPITNAETALTSAGSTTSRPLAIAGYTRASYQMVLSSVGTNVTVRVEGSNNNTDWAPLTTDQVVTANGSYLYGFTAIAGYVRFTLVSISGGTPSVAATLLRCQ